MTTTYRKADQAPIQSQSRGRISQNNRQIDIQQINQRQTYFYRPVIYYLRHFLFQSLCEGFVSALYTSTGLSLAIDLFG